MHSFSIGNLSLFGDILVFSLFVLMQEDVIPRRSGLTIIVKNTKLVLTEFITAAFIAFGAALVFIPSFFQKFEYE